MSWVRNAHEMPRNPKVALLSDAAFRLMETAKCWSSEFRMDGLIPFGIPATLTRAPSGNKSGNKKSGNEKLLSAIRELTDSGLWEEKDDGYWIHDYLKYNPSKAELAIKAESGRFGGVRSGERRRSEIEACASAGAQAKPKQRLDVTSSPIPIPIPVPFKLNCDADCEASQPASAIMRVAAPAKAEAPKPKGKAGPKEKPQVDPAGHPRVVEHYFRTFEAKRGTKPIFGGAEGRAVQTLLAKCAGNAEEAEKIITTAFAGWMSDTVTIRDIASNPAKHQGGLRPGRAGSGPKQPSSGYQYRVAAEGEF